MATAVQRAQAVLGNVANADQSNIDVETAKNIADAAWAIYTQHRTHLTDGTDIPESPTWEQKAVVLLNMTREYYLGLLTVETRETYDSGRQAVVDAALADPNADIGSNEQV